MEYVQQQLETPKQAILSCVQLSKLISNSINTLIHTMKCWPLILLIVIFLQANNGFSAPIQWRRLTDGMSYSKIAFPKIGPQSFLHVFRINLKKFQVRLGFAKDHQHNNASIRQFANWYHALIAINGGFFTPQQNPIGLRVDNGKIRNPLHPTRWWGIFFIRHHHPSIVPLNIFKKTAPKVKLAIQSGPILLYKGKIKRLKPNFDERSALGIDPQHHLLIAVTENAPLTTTQLANLFKKSYDRGGLNCIDAINLDGGASSQLTAKIKKFAINIDNLNYVTDAILILPNATN